MRIPPVGGNGLDRAGGPGAGPGAGAGPGPGPSSRAGSRARTMGTLQDTVSDPGAGVGGRICPVTRGNGDPGGSVTSGPGVERAGGPLCAEGFGVRCAWECLGTRVPCVWGYRRAGVGVPTSPRPPALLCSPWDPRELACGQPCLVKAGAGSLPHCGASPRGGCAGKGGDPHQTPPAAPCPEASPPSPSTSCTFWGREGCTPVCAWENVRSFVLLHLHTHPNFWGRGCLEGFTPAQNIPKPSRRPPVRHAGSLTRVPGSADGFGCESRGRGPPCVLGAGRWARAGRERSGWLRVQGRSEAGTRGFALGNEGKEMFSGKQLKAADGGKEAELGWSVPEVGPGLAMGCTEPPQEGQDEAWGHQSCHPAQGQDA